MRDALDIQVKGIVQGVGFRPFVYRMAKKYLINGWVLNATDGVFIHAEGDSKLLDEFVLELSENPPAASRVQEVALKEVPLENFESFEIRFSDVGAVEKTTLVSPDLATCDDCARELFDPGDRRFRYPFINCTNCGPRFTIIENLPYDRKSTSMREFPMCERCAAEYGDPLDRRFHAQPDACFECGPHVSWREHEGGAVEEPLGAVSWGGTREESDAIFARAVALLRARKRREGKAFAVMMASVDDVRAVCRVNDAEASALRSSQRPIVLLRKRPGAVFAPGLADDLPELGVMLPYTPVQHLLLHDFRHGAQDKVGGAPGFAQVPPMLVMTSANLHDEPIVIDDEDAHVKLLDVADAFLGHDRAILARYDDSVVRVIRAGSADVAVQFIRRARGFAPLPLPLACQPRGAADCCAAKQVTQGAASHGVKSGVADEGLRTEARGASASPTISGVTETLADIGGSVTNGVEGLSAVMATPPAILAVGPEQKNTFTLTRDAEAFVSQHIGDLENAETYDAWIAAKDRYEALFEIAPTRLACDLHPEYLATKWARERSGECGLPLVEVQHHHAHIASVMGEHGLRGPVCGIAFDGTGYGADGVIWGGEVLLSNLRAFERFANFAYVPMPGGAAAVKHPLRMAYGVLWAFDLLDHPGAVCALAALGEQATVCGQMIERGINTPMTSSVGRLFDAASALLGICVQPTYEGEPAILLEAALGDQADATAPIAASDASGTDDAARYAIAVVKNAATAGSTAQDTSVVLFDAEPTFRALLDDKVAGVSLAVIARRFHDAFAQAVVDAAELVRSLYDIDVVALGGGVFMNRYLVEHALAALEQAGFTVAVNRDLPPNDGCISFGQAVVAWATNEENELDGV